MSASVTSHVSVESLPCSSSSSPSPLTCTVALAQLASPGPLCPSSCPSSTCESNYGSLHSQVLHGLWDRQKEMIPPKMPSLSCRTWKWYLIWQMSWKGVNMAGAFKLRILRWGGYPGLWTCAWWGWGRVLIAITYSLIRGREREISTHRGEGDMKKEQKETGWKPLAFKIGVMLPQGTERREHPEAETGKQGFSPEPAEKPGPANTLTSAQWHRAPGLWENTLLLL